ncbi:MAG: glycosyltransferase [Arenicella sp.]
MDNQAQNLLIVIVNYFMADDCCRLIESIYEAQPHTLKRIVCVDNSCDQQQFTQLEQLKRSLENRSNTDIVLDFNENSENKGFGAAINAAVEHQLTRDRLLERVLLINPDVELEKESIETLLDGASRCPEAGIWGGVTMNHFGEPDGFHAWREPTALREIAWCLGLSKFLPINALVGDYRREHKRQTGLTHYAVDVVSGCFLLITSRLWNDVKGFDERFFLYSEEVDLCIRARHFGANPHVINTVKIKHVRGTSGHDVTRMKWLVNSKLLYWQKHHGVLKKRLLQYLYALGYLWRGLAFCVVPQRRHQAQSWIKLACALLFNKTLVKR